ncbi:MAG: TetR/AcrR family transcriptional regulator [Raoultibacter sp.]|jgi:AcrR family transcriptional regulator
MYLQPKDSRQRYTKQCLFDSFLNYLEQKSVSEITVSEISESAGVSRKTFYKYYTDQFALLKAMQEDLFAEFEAHVKDLPADVYAIVPALIEFTSRHRVLLRAVFENRSEGNFIDRVLTYMYDNFHTDWEASNPTMSVQDVKFLFFYVTSGLTGILRLWLFEEPEMSVEEISVKAAYLMTLTTPA